MSDRRPSAYACLYVPPVRAAAMGDAIDPAALLEIAQAFSPRYERHHDRLISIDVTGLERLMRPVRRRSSAGSHQTMHGLPETMHGLPAASAPESEFDSVHAAWRTMGQELLRVTIEKQVRAHVAVAGTRVAALVLAHARPGLTVTVAGQEAAALAGIPIDVLEHVADAVLPPPPSRAMRQAAGGARRAGQAEQMGIATFRRWAIRTLGELAALPAAALTARLGRQALAWQTIARGEDVRPLVPSEPEERFERALELEWPIDGLEPLSFVLTRLLEPLATQLERRDRGAAVLHVLLDLVSRDVHARHLQLPSPIRDVRTLRTLALLDIESHPPAGAIDRVTVVIDPTPGRIVQHTLFTRAVPTPERLSTLLARLSAVIGGDRVGAPAVVDTYRPGAFAMTAFSTDHTALASPQSAAEGHRAGADRQPAVVSVPRRNPAGDGGSAVAPTVALRRCRQPVPARVVVEAGRPVRVTTDRRGFSGGAVLAAEGPWRTSGHWWDEASPATVMAGPWDRDEWEVALSDGARYRVFRDRTANAWFIDGMFD